jgi:hypothetical protein
MFRSIKVLAATALASAAAAVPAYASTRVPLSAAGFRDSMGVNTHVGYTNTAYNDWPAVLNALTQLGVTHVRDLVINNGVTSYMQQWTRNVEAAAARGIRFDFVMPEPTAALGSVSSLVSTMGGPTRNAVEAIEDPNEFDINTTSPAWATTLASDDRQIYSAVRSTSSLAGVPVIGPSLVQPASFSTMGNQSGSLDDGNLHAYDFAAPSLSFIDGELATERQIAGAKPVWVTEFGFTNAMNDVGGDPPVSQKAAAIDILRMYLGNYMAGVPRSYAYELVDEEPDPGFTSQEDHFGLMNYNLTPKPAFTALKNLLAVIGRPTALTSLTPITLTVASPSIDIQSVLLERDASQYQLILWRNDSVWNSITHRDITVPSAQVTITAPGFVSASSARPLVSATQSVVPVHAGTMTMTASADPVVITLTRRAVSQARPAYSARRTRRARRRAARRQGVRRSDS